jgi:hypothetical protein
MAEERPTLADRLRVRSGCVIGPVFLAAWFAMLYFMFGDVL